MRSIHAIQRQEKPSPSNVIPEQSVRQRCSGIDSRTNGITRIPREACCQRWHLSSERGLHLPESGISTGRQCGAIYLERTRCSHTSIAVNFTGTLAPCAPRIVLGTVWNKIGKNSGIYTVSLGAEVGCWRPNRVLETGCWTPPSTLSPAPRASSPAPCLQHPVS